MDNERISFRCIEPAANFELQGDYDVILHKAQYLLKKTDPELERRYREYLNARPNTAIIDPFEVIEYSMNRNVFLERLKASVGDGKVIQGSRVRAPWNYKLEVVTDEAVTHLELAMQASGVHFPIMLKTELQSGISISHTMRIAFTIEGIRSAGHMYPISVIAQEFINHNAAVYKVYAIGHFSAVFPRKSCGNIKSPGIDFIDFETNKPWPGILKSESDAVILDLDPALVVEVSDIVSEFTGASLFGYDILVQDGTNDLVIVDFNSMPGFTELSDVSEPLWRLIEEKARR